MFFRTVIPLLFLTLTAAASDECVRKLEHVVIEKNYQKRRGLNEYLKAFPAEWEQSLLNLTSNDLWMDAGAGEGFAVQQYLSSKAIIDDFLHRADLNGPIFLKEIRRFYEKVVGSLSRGHRAQVLAITYQRYGYVKPVPDQTEFKFNHPLETAGRLKYLTGRFFEDILHSELGRPKLITDFFGIMAYTRSIDQTLKKYLDVLDDDGEIYLYLGSEQSDGWSDLTKITTLAQHEINIHKWLMALRGVNVERFINPNWENAVTLRITRIEGQTPCIPRLKLERVMDGAIPPVRFFKELGGCI